MRSKQQMSVRVWLPALAWAAAVGCNMISGADDLVLVDPDDTGGGGTTASGAGGTSSSTGGASSTGGSSSSSTSTSSSTSASSSTSTSSSTSASSTSASSTSSTGTTDPWEQYRQACIDRINDLRATLSLPPYQRWTSAESCVDQQATHDQSVNIPHDAFANGTPSCGGYGQNECPNWGAASITSCLDSMWAERDQPGCSGCDLCDTFTIFQGNCPDCTFNGATVCGHYVNMSSATFSQAACGFSTDGSWAAINFQ